MKFDIVEPVGHAYRFLWVERRYIMRVAAVPIGVKLLCHLGVEAFGYETQFVRQALVMLPSFFMDGWLLAHVIRFALFGQRWPFRPAGGDDFQILQDRAQGIMSGTAMYVVTRFLLAGLLGFLYIQAMKTLPPGAAPTTPPAPLLSAQPTPMSSRDFLGALVMLMAGLWAFRLLWLYIPAAANISLTHFLKRINGFAMSFGMMGLWLISALPLFVVFMIVTSVLVQPYGPTAASLPVFIDVAIGILWVATDTAIEIVTTFAMSLGLRPALIDASTNDRTHA